jgi:hypothetical protein
MRTLWLAFITILSFATNAQPARRAVLIGIDDYTASTLPVVNATRQHAGWPDLRGAANDVRILNDMLVLRYGFERKNIITLTNQQATRTAILRAIEQHLVRPSRRGDVVFYYFAGHGAQVPNAASDEPDRLDESIVPADSRRGAEDIRDKELRPLFNRILERGAHLTLLLDHCHSGGGFRGLPNGARPRGIAPAPPIVDKTNYGPRPDRRGALVLAASQDFERAWEWRGEDGLMHGAFTWAWIRAMRDAAGGEPAQETFLRAQARLRGERADQAPAMFGEQQARLRPFLGMIAKARGERRVIAVESVAADGDVVLQGGWAHGLAMNSELTPIGDPTSRLRVTRLLGLGRSIARIITTRANTATIRAGALLEIARWAAPQDRPLRVHAPHASPNLGALARRFATATKATWIIDPLDVAPTHILRPREHGWELITRDGNSILVPNDRAAVAALAKLRPRDSLFVQFPATDSIAGADGITIVSDPQEADYLLAGRFHRERFEYAWIRPFARSSDRGGLPPRTQWTSDAMQLRRDLITLRRIHGWFALASPPDSPTPYHLAVRDETRGQLVDDTIVFSNRLYSLALRASQPTTEPAFPRYYYVFVVDSHGNSRLIFPATGSGENRFPLDDRLPALIPLGEPSAFRIKRPYGIDTYFLLSTAEPLPNPAILEWDGVRARRALGNTPWSIERITLESAAPPRRRGTTSRAAPRRR